MSTTYRIGDRVRVTAPIMTDTESTSNRLAEDIEVSRRDRTDGYRRTKMWRLIAGTIISEVREVYTTDLGHEVVDLSLPGDDTIYTARASEVVFEGERPAPADEIVALKEAIAHLDAVKGAHIGIYNASPAVVAWIREQRSGYISYTTDRGFMSARCTRGAVEVSAHAHRGEPAFIEPAPKAAPEAVAADPAAHDAAGSEVAA